MCQAEAIGSSFDIRVLPCTEAIAVTGEIWQTRRYDGEPPRMPDSNGMRSWQRGDGERERQRAWVLQGSGIVSDGGG